MVDVFDVLLALMVGVPFCILLGWMLIRTIKRARKRKVYGEKMLVVRDPGSDKDICMSIIYFAVFLFLMPKVSLTDLTYFFYYAWLIPIVLYSIFKLTKGLSKIEIYQKGIITKDKSWNWEATNNFTLSERNNTSEYNFELSQGASRQVSLKVYSKDKAAIEHVLSDVFAAL